ncbi:MAG TPA: hypothetical protein VFV38_31375 [Ktedonobacteraceae bacterium]|nr:hypothetical protein [Ktedonobacteraceae bacterium]
MDPFANRYVKAIKEAKTDEDLEAIVNHIYEDGFSDGASEGCDDEPDDSNLRSDCHNAPVERRDSPAGHYYQCTVCNDPCDVDEAE